MTSPNDPSMTVYEEWLKYDPDASGKPMLVDGACHILFVWYRPLISDDFSPVDVVSLTVSKLLCVYIMKDPLLVVR